MSPAVLAAACAGVLACGALFEAAGGAAARRRTALAALLGRLASAVGASLARRAGARTGGRPLEDRILAAGAPLGLGVPEWLVLRAACAGCALAGAVVLGALAPARTGVTLIAAAPVAGFLVPAALLTRLARGRVAAARRDLPDMLDLLEVTVSAGLPAMRAIDAVGAEFDGLLAGEWRELAAVVALGEPHASALERMERRLPCEEVRAFARALRESRRLGAPLARALAAQAAAARHARAARVREAAARAGPQIQLVVALALVPSVLLMVAAALLTAIAGAGLGLPE